MYAIIVGATTQALTSHQFFGAAGTPLGVGWGDAALAG
jgi:hypothetical protein